MKLFWISGGGGGGEWGLIKIVTVSRIRTYLSLFFFFFSSFEVVSVFLSISADLFFVGFLCLRLTVVFGVGEKEKI